MGALVRRPAPRRAAAWLAALGLCALAAARPLHAGEALRVEVDGVKGDLKKNIMATLSIEAQRKDKDLDESQIERLHGKAPGEISQALQPFGYYRSLVDASLGHDGTTWVARYKVDPGPQLKVNSLDVKVLGAGAGDAHFQRLTRDFPLHQGDPMLQVPYESGKKAFDDYAAGHGYLDGKFETSEIRIDLAAYTADVVVHYESGPQYRYGPVRFHQSFLKPRLVEGFVRFKRGEPIQSAQLLQLQQSLSDTNYFQRVEVVPQKAEAQGLEVPIDVNLTPSRPQKWTAGAGYGTDTGPRGTAGLELRDINEEGHRFTSEADVSQVDKSFRADYLIPDIHTRTDMLDFTVAYADLTPVTSRSLNLLAGPSYSMLLGRWHQTFSLDYQRESYTVGPQSGLSDLVIPQVTWSRVFANDRLYPTRGESYNFLVRGGAKDLLSDDNFAQAQATAKFIQSFGQKKVFRLITRATIGSTWTSDFSHLPPSERFFAGGDQSVRGYAFEGIGALEQGQVIGGPDLLVGSVEFQYRLARWQALQKFGVATFFDAGGAGYSFGGEIKEGTGLGIFWISPIGPIRVYVATALSIPGHPLRLHLTIGPDL